MWKRTLAASVAAAGLTVGWAAPASAQGPAVRIEADGAVQMPAMTVPVSGFLSPEGQAYLADHLKAMQAPDQVAQVNGVPVFMAKYIARQRELFPVEEEAVKIAGVGALDYLPKGGVPPENRNRILINLHGGGFSGCFPGCAQAESIPLASLARTRVISLDYRQAPAHRFPAASEDVAAVYRELLKTYPAGNIGIYGCSAGGMLAGMSVAWFLKEGLPLPGAVGIFCAGSTLTSIGFGGDAAYFAGPLGEARAAPATPPPGARPGPPPLAYLAGVDPNDPLAAPAASPDVLRRFPPTLFITGTRSFELSSAVYTHTQMVKLGVDARLHVWEGMFHGFFSNPDVPESREAFDVMVRFFDSRLGR